MNGVTKTLHIDKYNVKKGEDVKGWVYYNLEEEKLFCPPEWHTVPGRNSYITLNIDPSDSATYLNVVRYKPAFQDTTYIMYFRNTYHIMSTNTIEVCCDPVLKRYLYNDKVLYDLQFRSVFNHVRYATFLYIFNRDGFTYEFFMKVHEGNAEEYQKTFDRILSSFLVNGKPIFNIDQKLEEIQDIDISKI